MTVRGGVLVQTSVSEIESFDHEQDGGCERRWWFERAMELRPDSKKSQVEGEAGHGHLARYLKTGERPRGHALMGKAVNGVIAKGALPALGEDLLVELRFDGGEKHRADLRCYCGHLPAEHGKKGKRECEANVEGEPCDCGNYSPAWLPLDVSNTLHLAGVPLEGFIDLTFRRGPIPEIWDHKFFTPCRPEIDPDPYAWLKKPSQLIKTVQMPVYVLSQVPYWPDAKQWRLVHHCVSKKGTDSQLRSAVVHIDQVLERKANIEATVERMKALAPVEKQTEVPFNRRSCSAWGGCPHQSVCSAFKKETQVMSALAPEEDALFADLDADDAPPAAPAPQPEPAAKPARRMLIVEGEPVPDPSTASAPVVEAAVTCACSAVITAENGSKLQSGAWKHINCPLDKKAEETPAPRARKPKAAAPPAAPPKVDSAPAPRPSPKPFVGETATNQAATAALDAIQASTPSPASQLMAMMPTEEASAREKAKRQALASVFDSIAALLRVA